jgi:hypothetical protein
MVELLPINPQVKGSSPAVAAAGNGREKNGDKVYLAAARGGTTLGKAVE